MNRDEMTRKVAQMGEELRARIANAETELDRRDAALIVAATQATHNQLSGNITAAITTLARGRLDPNMFSRILAQTLDTVAFNSALYAYAAAQNADQFDQETGATSEEE